LAAAVRVRRRTLTQEEAYTLMKKLLTLLFTFALAFSLAMPVFAQDAPAAGQDTAAPKAEKKEKKAKKAKKSKKEKKEAKSDEMK